MTLLSISSCLAALLCFTDLKAFSNASKVTSLLFHVFLYGKSVSVSFTFSRDFFHYLPCACHIILTILKYRLIVCLLSFFTQFLKKIFVVLVNLFILSQFFFQKFNIQFLFLLRRLFQTLVYPWCLEVLYFENPLGESAFCIAQRIFLKMFHISNLFLGNDLLSSN